ncbi:MAG: DUF3078 domain-containing protein [Bacteroidales bacterium]|nr:DUF3078 domain-containing protein [Bacteroidales bacterium]
MKRLMLCLLLLLSVTVGFAQDQAPAPAPKPDSAAIAKPVYWSKGLTTQIGFSQISLTNWAAGGYGSIALNTYLNTFFNYKKGKYIWDNQLQVGYGFIQSFEDGYKKSDDRLIIDSKFGYQAVESLYFSAVFNTRTQFTKGYEKNVMVSDFFAPAYVSLGLGVDYKPKKNLSINFAPLTGKVVMVKEESLRVKYGNLADQFCKFELGAQVKVDGKIQVDNFKVVSALTLFSDYLDHPLNIKVYWDFSVDAKITKSFTASLKTNLIYDDAIKFLDKTDKRGNIIYDEDGNTIKVPGVQFKELFSLGFSYSFGDKKK